MARFNVAWSGGALLGNALAGLLFDFGPAFPFYAAAAISVIQAGLTGFSKAPSRDSNTSKFESEKPHPVAWQTRRLLFLAWPMNFGAFFGLGVAFSFFPSLTESLGFTPGQASLLFAALPATRTFGFMIYGWSDRWKLRVSPPLVAGLLGGCAFLIIANARSYAALLVGLALAGWMLATTANASLFYSLAASNSKAKYAGFHESIMVSGVAMGSLIGGVLAQSWGIRIAFAAVAIIITMTKAMGFWMYAKASYDISR